MPVLTAKAVPPGALGIRLAEEVTICKGGEVVSRGHGAAPEKLSEGGELPGGTLAPPSAH